MTRRRDRSVEHKLLQAWLPGELHAKFEVMASGLGLANAQYLRQLAEDLARDGYALAPGTTVESIVETARERARGLLGAEPAPDLGLVTRRHVEARESARATARIVGTTVASKKSRRTR